MKKDYSKIREAYSKAIEKYGDNGTLYTFEMCSNKGISIDGSTIDCIENRYGDIFLVFNENTGDRQLLEEFKATDLMLFLCDILSVLGSKVFVLKLTCDRRGISENSILGVFSTRMKATRAFKERRDAFLEDLDEDEAPDTLDPELDSYTDEEDRFTYYRYAKDDLFSLEIAEEEIDEN